MAECLHGLPFTCWSALRAPLSAKSSTSSAYMYSLPPTRTQPLLICTTFSSQPVKSLQTTTIWPPNQSSGLRRASPGYSTRDMASLTRHLLTLPCEIRDNIYPYLLQDVSFQYKWADHDYSDYAGTGKAGYYLSFSALSTDVQVCVHKAPPPNILLTHSRLNEESRDRSLRNLSATIRIEQQNTKNSFSPLPTRLSVVSINGAFFHI
jgi:hypothetical protein